METQYSFFLPVSESGLWTRDVSSLSPYFFEKVIFRSIGKLLRLFPDPHPHPQFASLTSFVDRAHSSFSLLKIMLTEGQFDSLQSHFISTKENDPYFPKIFLWVTV